MEDGPFPAYIHVNVVQRVHLLIRDLIRRGVVDSVVSLTFLKHREPLPVPDPFILGIQVFDKVIFSYEFVPGALGYLIMIDRLHPLDSNA